MVTERARLHLREIYAYHAQFSETSARRRLRHLRDRWRRLPDHPWQGRAVPEFGLERLRELIDPPYRIIYQVFVDRVEIIAIRHGAEDLRPPPSE